MMKKYLFFLSILFLLTNLSLGQNKKSKYFFHYELNKTVNSYRNQKEFYKTYQFYVKEEWDSIIVYSSKQLIKKDILVDDYYHFFRAKSFREKKLLVESQKEFRLIPKTFKFYSLVITNLGEIALEQNRYKESLHFFTKAEREYKNNYYFNWSGLYHNIGLCYFHLNQFDKAEQYLFKGLQIQEKEKDSILLIGSYMDIANLYYEQYKDQQAIPYFEKAYQLSKKVNNFELQQNAALNMAVVEENKKNFPKALVYRKEMEQWKDSLNDQNKVWAIAEIEKKYAVNQKQKEIRVLEVENKVKIAERNGFLYSSILLLGLFATAIYFYKQKIKRNKIILSQKQDLDELNATKDKLFSIVSHDLRSSVNALKTSTSKLITNLESKNYTELDTLLHRNSSIANSAYNLLDNLLNWALLQTKQMYFQQESQHLYSIVQQIEFNYKPLFLDKNIHFENTISKDIFVFVDLDSLKIILRNLLDNAIKFSEANDSISIYTRDSNDEFCNLIIEDTGIGMDNQTQQELLKDTTLLSKKGNNEAIGSGLGIQLCKSMIIKNGGKLAIESQKDIGTKFIVSLLKIEKHG